MIAIPRPDDRLVYDVEADPRLQISAQNFDRLAQFIMAESGIKLPASKVSMLRNRIAGRVRKLEMNSIDEYCGYLLSTDGAENEYTHFINAVTTNKTDFFREPQHFHFLTGTAIPGLARSGSAARDIAVWSAGCASGEEPYTLAMVLSEYASSHSPWTFRILATDLSTKVLQIAIDGIYAQNSIAAVPAELRRKYFLQSKTAEPFVRIKAALRQRVSFHQLNFMEENYGVREMFDVIFCRNVLIYFDRPTQHAVIGKLCRNLRPRGYLFISHSESLSGMDLPLVALRPSCFQKLEE